MKLVAWSYPRKGCLQDLIESAGLHPLTCLTSLSQGQKSELLEQDIVLCRDLLRAEAAVFKVAGISVERQKRMRDEAALVCNSKNGRTDGGGV